MTTLTLFFTRGHSLRDWINVGMFDREVALYRQLLQAGIQVQFVTYGNASEMEFTERIPGIRILCNWLNLAPKRYERWLPFLHAPWLYRSGVFKTNQMDGAEIALRAAHIWRKPFIARCGYVWSFNLAQEHGETSDVAIRARQIEERVFPQANHAVVTTTRIAQQVTERIPEIASRISVIPNYVETDRFAPEVGTKDYDIIFIGRLAPEKNVDILLEAITPLDVNICIIGSGRLEME